MLFLVKWNSMPPPFYIQARPEAVARLRLEPEEVQGEGEEDGEGEDDEEEDGQKGEKEQGDEEEGEEIIGSRWQRLGTKPRRCRDKIRRFN